MHAHKMQVKLTAVVVVRVIDKEEREGSDQCQARQGYIRGQWVEQPTRELTLAQRSMVPKETSPRK